MSAMLPARRMSLAANYRDRSETEIRARLDGELGDAERVVARAELLRRGLGSDAQDTAPATGFEPTAFPEPVEAEPLLAVSADAQASSRGGRTWKIVAVLLALSTVGALALAMRLGFIVVPRH
ncbi:MAG: hypothetical protein ABJD97_20505 [Betaproteobacteria bacterium]